MRCFKKVVFSLLLFAMIFSFSSLAFISAYLNTNTYDYQQDTKYRNSIAGSINYLILGASLSVRGFIPLEIDEELKVNSYNLSGIAMSLNGRKALLEEEIERNPIDTVIIDLCVDDILIDGDKRLGDVLTFSRLGNNRKKIRFFFENIKIEDYLFTYATLMRRGMHVAERLLTDTYSDNGFENKGYRAANSADVFKSNEIVMNSFKQNHLNLSINEYYVQISELVRMCTDRKIDVILVSLPISDSRLWETDNYDDLHKIFSMLAGENSCQYIDFNLVKNRSEIYSDRYSFYDSIHLSSTGAEAFTNCFCDVMKKLQNGEDVSDMFYDSYEEAITHFEYYDIYQRLTQGK